MATEKTSLKFLSAFNNQGTRLGQADFVLTLLSVYHGELRDRIEERSREMSEGSVVAIDTQQFLRAICGVAFSRARCLLFTAIFAESINDGESGTPPDA